MRQTSRPHCELTVQAFAPGGSARQLPARQYWPPLQSVFFAHTEEHTPLLQASFDLQSLAALHLGNGAHFPALQAQDEAHSEFSEHEDPGQPKVQSSQGSRSTMQPARSRGVSNNAKRKFIGLVERGEVIGSALDSIRCLVSQG